MTESASRAKWKKGFFLFFKKWGLLIFVIKTSIKYFFRNENNMVPCLWRNKLSNKYIRDKVEIMVVLFFERWKSVDKLWCLWTNYGLTLQWLETVNIWTDKMYKTCPIGFLYNFIKSPISTHIKSWWNFPPCFNIFLFHKLNKLWKEPKTMLSYCCVAIKWNFLLTNKEIL